jgi:hypothetical protein
MGEMNLTDFGKPNSAIPKTDVIEPLDLKLQRHIHNQKLKIKQMPEDKFKNGYELANMALERLLIDYRFEGLMRDIFPKGVDKNV